MNRRMEATVKVLAQRNELKAKYVALGVGRCTQNTVFAARAVAIRNGESWDASAKGGAVAGGVELDAEDDVPRGAAASRIG